MTPRARRRCHDHREATHSGTRSTQDLLRRSCCRGGIGIPCRLFDGCRPDPFTPCQSRVLYFHEGLAATAQGVLFLMLGILVFPSRLLDDLGLAIVVAAALILLARPIAVAVVLLPWRTPVGQMVVVSWAGLRGAVPVVAEPEPDTDV